MLKLLTFLIFLSTLALAASSSCSQTQLAHADTTNYVGSTPCDSLINSMLEIPANVKCEFIKWKVGLYKSEDAGGTFSLALHFGESQPNTNGFKNGGNRFDLSGSYMVHKGTTSLPRANVYELHSTQIKSPIWLVQMDDNIFHFADSGKNLIVGNGGFGYVLNRINK